MAATDVGQQGAGTRAAGVTRTLVTPEGVALPVQLAERGERLAAFLLDFVLMGAIVLALFLLLLLAVGSGVSSGWEIPVVIVISFLLRSFYFAFFELRWQGSTPGKRLLKMRVIDNRGGPLRTDSVIARNLMREIEVFLPMSLILMLDAEDGGNWMTFLSVVWVFVLVLMPFFNRDRMRVGDMVGGTWVIAEPKSVLLPDLIEKAATGPARARAIKPAPPAAPASAATAATAATGSDPEGFEFTNEQLGIYGIYELQVLEDVLRQEGPNAPAARHEVAKRIQRKIQWQGTASPARAGPFLEAFYAALRGHLEKRMLFGDRRENKHDGKPRLKPPGSR